MATSLYGHYTSDISARTDAYKPGERTVAALSRAAQTGKALTASLGHQEALRLEAERVAAAKVEEDRRAAELARQQEIAALEAAAVEAAKPMPEAEAIAAAPVPTPSTDLEAYIYEVAAQYGQDPTAMIRVMYCESSGNPGADNGVCKGLFQFHPGTWASTPEGAAGASIWDGYAQIRMTAWMWSVGRRGEWACT